MPVWGDGHSVIGTRFLLSVCILEIGVGLDRRVGVVTAAK